MLVFTTAPLTAALTVIGYVSCTLYVRSSLPHTDFICRLLDVYPGRQSDNPSQAGGRSVVLCDGICRITPVVLQQCTEQPGQQKTQAQAHHYTPVLKLQVEMCATANVFHVGHRIRIHGLTMCLWLPFHDADTWHCQCSCHMLRACVCCCLRSLQCVLLRIPVGCAVWVVRVCCTLTHCFHRCDGWRCITICHSHAAALFVLSVCLTDPLYDTLDSARVRVPHAVSAHAHCHPMQRTVTQCTDVCHVCVQIAHQVVYHDSRYPSAIHLPVMPE